MCKGLWKLPAVNDPNMQELVHVRIDLQKAQEEQLAEITRISKELECFEPVGVPLVVVHYGSSHDGALCH